MSTDADILQAMAKQAEKGNKTPWDCIEWSQWVADRLQASWNPCTRMPGLDSERDLIFRVAPDVKQSYRLAVSLLNGAASRNDKSYAEQLQPALKLLIEKLK